MSCCTAEGTDRFFSRKSRRYARQFRKKGMDKAQKLIVAALMERGVQGRSLLEIGCGVGGLLLSLLERGAGSAVGVEISEGMLDQAKRLAEEQGMADRTRYVLADILTADGRIPGADIVILDKVICCNAEPLRVIEESARRAGSLYALVFPNDSLFGKMAFKPAQWLGERLKWKFHPYYHEPAMIGATVRGQGFAEVASSRTFIWQIQVYERTGTKE